MNTRLPFGFLCGLLCSTALFCTTANAQLNTVFSDMFRTILGPASLQKAGKLALASSHRDALEAFAPRCREPLARALLEQLLGR